MKAFLSGHFYIGIVRLFIPGFNWFKLKFDEPAVILPLEDFKNNKIEIFCYTKIYFFLDKEGFLCLVKCKECMRNLLLNRA